MVEGKKKNQAIFTKSGKKGSKIKWLRTSGREIFGFLPFALVGPSVNIIEYGQLNNGPTHRMTLPIKLCTFRGSHSNFDIG